MNRRNVFQLAAASIVAPSAVLAAPVAKPAASVAELQQMMGQLMEAMIKHKHPTSFGPASPSSITIPPRPFRAYPPTKAFP